MADTSAATSPLSRSAAEGLGRALARWGGIAFWARDLIAAALICMALVDLTFLMLGSIG